MYIYIHIYICIYIYICNTHELTTSKEADFNARNINWEILEVTPGTSNRANMLELTLKRTEHFYLAH